ncbi:MAG: hypothetical protein F4Z01_09315 [Gammaproteobacteria bacterium]|nr:hypothetical protein [Gammaproteobacteria bacterium]MYF37550.1 hypothetical protein [Gammaproteobacteria bacterium]
MSLYRYVWSLFLVTAVMSLLSGCGFYLRTTTLGSYLSTVNLDVAKSPLLERELERAFLLNDVSVSDSESADLSIRLKDSEFQKSTSLVVPREGLQEYELILQVTFTIWFDGDQSTAEDVSFTKAGRVRVHPEQLLSTSAEEQTVRTELTKGVIENFVQDLYLRLAQDQETE